MAGHDDWTHAEAQRDQTHFRYASRREADEQGVDRYLHELGKSHCKTDAERKHQDC